MSDWPKTLWNDFAASPLVIQGVAFALAIMLVTFLIWFLIPAIRLNYRLRRALKALKRAELSGPVDLKPAFKDRGVLAHLWSEYFDTLHSRHPEHVVAGKESVLALRATQPSANFFTQEAIVDSVVGTEFFKHLPGLFTGIGIIGTFYGLISGLSAFQRAGFKPGDYSGLEILITSVSHAFIVSACAILLAMLTTAIEKGLLVRLYKKVEALTHAIDERFKAGVGEEYLSRLVTASEDSASQTRILKDALVEDLRTLLTEVVDRQIAAQASSSTQLGDRIAQVFNAELSAPIEKIASAVQKVGQSQGEAVHSLLSDVLAAFSSKMEGMFGSQLTGIHDLQQQTVAALQGAVAHLEGMARTIEGAGTKAADSMAQQMTEAIRKLESRQTVLNEEMRKFVGDIRDLVKNSQLETGSHLQGLLQELTERTGGVINALSDQSRNQAEGMGAHLRAVTEAVGSASTQLARAVDRLEGITTDAIGRMNVGADTLAAAAGSFAKAGDGVRDVLGRSEVVGRHLTESAGSVSTAVRALDSVVGDYKAQQSIARGMLEVAQKTVESARREASLTEEVVRTLGEASQRLSAAQHTADQYLERVSSVLEEAHGSFAQNMAQTLKAGNKAFYESLTQATSLLREAIEEFETALDRDAVR